MSVDFGPFEFACPPLCGGEWFADVCWRVLGLPCYSRELFGDILTEPFPAKRGEKLRITLVRHPWDWLWDCSAFVADARGDLGPRFDAQWRLLGAWLGFRHFALGYLEKMPGVIRQLYAGYRADSALRIEDMPEALAQTAEAAGLPAERIAACRRVRLPVEFLPRPVSDDLRELRRRVIEAERAVCDACDYY